MPKIPSSGSLPNDSDTDVTGEKYCWSAVMPAMVTLSV